MTSLFRFAYVMALRRAVSGWRLEAVLFGGTLLAVALMASGVVFSDLLANAALRHALRQATPQEANFWVRSFISQDEPLTSAGRKGAHQARLDFAESRVSRPFAPYLKEEARFLETATFFFEGHPNLELDNQIRPRGAIAHMSGLSDERVRLVDGSWPQGAGPIGSPVEVAVDVLGAGQLLQLGVGDTMEVFPAASFIDPPRMTVRISGIFERTNPDDEFWYASKSSFSLQNDRWTIVPLFTSEEALLDQVLGVYPAIYTDTTWHYYLDRDVMRAREVGSVKQIIANAERDIGIGLRNSSASIKLDNVLNDFDEQLLLARVPLLLVIFLVTGILIYYLALVAGLIVRSRTSEIAMLKSRGATTPQIGFLGLGEGLLLAVPAVIIGPFLAMVVVKVLGNLFFSLGGGASELAGVPVELSVNAFYLGLAGGALAVVVFTLATLAAARHGIVEARHSGARPPTVSFLHRYYLDILLVALVLLLWWQTQSRGAFLVKSLGSQELQIDYSLLLLPVLLLLAVGLVVMRLFPWLAALLSWMAGTVGPSWLVHALRHVARDPLVPGILIVLLMLATALGVIGSAFSSTLERSQRERALYAAGADVRVQHSGVGVLADAETLSGPVRELDGVAAVADVFRTSGHITTTGFSTSGELLAVDSETFAEVAWFREDFAGDQPIAGLVHSLRPDELGEAGVPLPENTTDLALWAQPGNTGGGVNLWARLKDSKGQYADIRMGSLGFRDWRQLSASLYPETPERGRFGSQRQQPVLVPPLSLMSFQITSQFGVDETGSLFLGRLDAITPSGEVPVVDFQRIGDWKVIEDFGRPGLYALETSRAVTDATFETSSRFSWSTGGVGMRGFRVGGPERPLPALVSPSFLEIADAEVGDQVILGMSTYSLLLDVVAVVDYFPTLDPAKRPFAIVDLAGFNQAANVHSPTTVSGPNELWVDFDGPSGGAGPPAATVTATMKDAGARVRETHDSAAMVALRVDQPLVSAGWGALMLLLFLAVALATGTGVMLFSYLDTRERQTEFALLRTLGSSGGQLNRIVWFNLFLMVVCGVALGSWIGQLIGSELLPLMETAEGGARVTPSMVLTTDGVTLMVTYLVLAGVTLMTVLWLAWLSSKIQLQQVLRMGDA